MRADFARERRVGIAGKNLEFVLRAFRHLLRFLFLSPASSTDHRAFIIERQIQNGWAGRIRTFECQVQSLVPYQLGDRPAKRAAGLEVHRDEPAQLNVLKISAERESRTRPAHHRLTM